MFEKEQVEALERMAQDAPEKIEEGAVDAYKKIEEGAVGTYKKIEDGVVGTYKKIEKGAVDGFNKIADGFVDKFFTKEGETVEEAKARMEAQRKANEEKMKVHIPEVPVVDAGKLAEESLQKSKEITEEVRKSAGLK